MEDGVDGSFDSGGSYIYLNNYIFVMLHSFSLRIEAAYL